MPDSATQVAIAPTDLPSVVDTAVGTAVGAVMDGAVVHDAVLNDAVLNNAVRNNAARWKRLMDLPCSVSVEVPVAGFTVRDLLKLSSLPVLGSAWPTSANLPVRVNGERIAWCELEAAGSRVAIRLTEIASAPEITDG
jgi:flagellar motor switch/type III secretory pathway protein FliN